MIAFNLERRTCCTLDSTKMPFTQDGFFRVEADTNYRV